MAVLLTTHSIVTILMVADFCRDTGKNHNIGPVRRANIMSIVVCIFPFILPYFIPVILMASMTNSENEFGIPSVSPLEVGMHNFLAIGLLLVVFPMIFFGYGRRYGISR